MNESPQLETSPADRAKHGRDPASLVLGLYFAWFALCVQFRTVGEISGGMKLIF